MQTVAEKAAWRCSGNDGCWWSEDEHQNSPVRLWSSPQLARWTYWKRQVKKPCVIRGWQEMSRFPDFPLIMWRGCSSG